MLPLKISLKNFISYGEEKQSLDFSKLSLACLNGKNGVGKSSLLEAITWSVWGKSRSGNDNSLIRLGATEMEVEFDIENRPSAYDDDSQDLDHQNDDCLE